MRNDYGVVLDKSGYAPSIIQEDTSCCWLCGCKDQKLDRHEPFNGPYRTESKRLGMWIVLCHERCHFGKAHKNFQIAMIMKRFAQKRAMEYYNWTTKEFVRRFGKNWL